METGVLGIDTSCYTTSLAVVNEEGVLCSDQRQLLPVPQGKRGLRQAEAIFKHLGNLPDLVQAMRQEFQGKLVAIAVTERPRPLHNSYLPVFRTGYAWGRTMASILGVPFFSFSHQENHLRVGKWSASGPVAKKFIAVHLSGGTTEILLVNASELGYQSTVVGKDLDLHAGQFVDRLGTSLGLPFPAGPYLEELATDGKPGAVSIPASVNGYDVSFSGPLTAALRQIKAGAAKADVALAVFFCIAKALEKIIRPLIITSGCREVLLVGGVAANKIIRERLRHRLEHPSIQAKLYFAAPNYSTDNAIGTSLLGLDSYQKLH
jgi:N6-L-threonylcarbamoyladenine synthase